MSSTQTTKQYPNYINLKGLQKLRQIRQKDQFQHLMQLFTEEKCDVILTKESKNQGFQSEVKFQKMEQPSIERMVYQVIVDEETQNCDNDQNNELSSEESWMIIIRSEQMLENYNNYGNIVYYQQLNPISLDSRSNIKVGILYGYSYELKLTVFASYFLYNFSQKSQYSYMLFFGLMKLQLRNRSRKFKQITFFTHSFTDLYTLRFLLEEYEKQLKKQGDQLIHLPKYSFLVDPCYTKNPIFSSLEEKQDIAKVLREMLGLQSFSELYFSQYPQQRSIMLHQIICQTGNYVNQMIEQTRNISNSIQINNYNLFLLFRVIEKIVWQNNEMTKQIISNNYKIIKSNQYVMLESEVPQLRLIKMEVSKAIYEYLLGQIVDALRWMVRNKSAEDEIDKFKVQIDEQDELYYQNLKEIRVKVQKSKANKYYIDDQDFFWVQKVKSKWQCQCRFSVRYGLPCAHEVKVCLLTNSLLQNQINRYYLNLNYYKNQNDEKMESKIELKKQQAINLERLSVKDGRHQITNYKLRSYILRCSSTKLDPGY